MLLVDPKLVDLSKNEFRPRELSFERLDLLLLLLCLGIEYCLTCLPPGGLRLNDHRADGSFLVSRSLENPIAAAAAPLPLPLVDDSSQSS